MKWICILGRAYRRLGPVLINARRAFLARGHGFQKRWASGAQNLSSIGCGSGPGLAASRDVQMLLARDPLHALEGSIPKLRDSMKEETYQEPKSRGNTHQNKSHPKFRAFRSPQT